MKKEKIIFYLPRVLIILVMAFLSLFSLDMWSEPNVWWKNLLGFIIHLSPVIILLLILLLTWKRDLIAAWLFGIFGMATVLFFDTYEQLAAFMAISFPIFITSGLYYWSYKIKQDKLKRIS